MGDTPWKTWKHIIKPSWLLGDYGSALFAPKMCAYLFDDCRLDQLGYLKKLQEVEGGNDNNGCSFAGRELCVSEDPSVCKPLRLISAICTAMGYCVTREDLHMLAIALKYKRIEPRDFEFVAETHQRVAPPPSVADIGFVYGRGVKLEVLRRLSPIVCAAPMTTELLSEIKGALKYHDTQKDWLLLDVQHHIEDYGFAVTDHCPIFDVSPWPAEVALFLFLFQAIVDAVPLTYAEWFAWLLSTLHHLSNNCEVLKVLLDKYPDHRGRVDRAQQASLLMQARETSAMETLFAYFPEARKLRLEWVDVARMHGAAAISAETFPAFAQIVNFNAKLPPKQKKWLWIGVGGLGEGTYASRPYQEDAFVVDEAFAGVRTLADLGTHLDVVRKLIRSPTDCYFDLKTEQKGGVFYRDQQDCVAWELEEKTGRVYISEPDNLFEQTYVSKSLPEFLSRVKSDADNFFFKRRRLHADTNEEG